LINHQPYPFKSKVWPLPSYHVTKPLALPTQNRCNFKAWAWLYSEYRKYDNHL